MTDDVDRGRQVHPRTPTCAAKHPTCRRTGGVTLPDYDEVIVSFDLATGEVVDYSRLQSGSRQPVLSRLGVARAVRF